MKPRSSRAVSGTRRCCRARTRSRGRVVTAKATAATHAAVPFRSRASAASSPFCDTRERTERPPAARRPRTAAGGRTPRTAASTASRAGGGGAGPGCSAARRGHEQSPSRAGRCCAGTDDHEQHEGEQAHELGVRRHPVSGVVSVDVEVRRVPGPTSALAPRRASPQDEDRPTMSRPATAMPTRPRGPRRAGRRPRRSRVAGERRRGRGGVACGVGEPERPGHLG